MNQIKKKKITNIKYFNDFKNNIIEDKLHKLAYFKVLKYFLKDSHIPMYF